VVLPKEKSQFLNEFVQLSNQLDIENAVENFDEIIPTFDENDTWENEVLYCPLESNEEEEEVELTPDADLVTPITFSEIKNDWYALKSKIEKKNCSHALDLIAKFDEAIYHDCKLRTQQSVIGDFFQITEPCMPNKRAKVVIEIQDDENECDI
jgi:hypothetical protein